MITWFCKKKSDDRRWEELNKEVMRLGKERRNDQALAAAKDLFELSKKRFGRRHPNTITALNNLGIIHTLRREFDEAEAYLLSALQISEKVSGRISEEVAVVNMNLSRLYSLKAETITEMLAAAGVEGATEPLTSSQS